MAVLGLLLGQMPQARTTRLLSGLLHSSVPAGSTLVELPYFDLPHHAPYEDAPMPRAGLEWKRRLAELDGLVVVTPTHERSLPGALKNALDWAHASPNALAGMPVAIAGAAGPRAGHFVTLQHLRTVLSDCGALVMGQPERSLTVDAARFGTSGLCVDHELEGLAVDLLSAAAGYAAFAGAPRASRLTHPNGPLNAEPARASSPSAGDEPTGTLDPVAAVREAQAAGPGPQSPALGIPTRFVSALSTVDPLIETGDPLMDAVSMDTSTGS